MKRAGKKRKKANTVAKSTPSARQTRKKAATVGLVRDLDVQMPQAETRRPRPVPSVSSIVFRGGSVEYR